MGTDDTLSRHEEVGTECRGRLAELLRRSICLHFPSRTKAEHCQTETSNPVDIGEGAPPHSTPMKEVTMQDAAIFQSALQPLTKLTQSNVDLSRNRIWFDGFHAATEVGLISKPRAAARRLRAAMLRWRCCSS